MIEQFFVTFALLSALLIYFFMYKGNKRLPPGPIRLPVLGSIIQIYRANPQYPHLALAKLADQYGDIMSFGFGMQTAVIVSSYEAMKAVFNIYDTNVSRFPFPYVFDRNYGKNLGIIWGHGRNWMKVKAFTKKILKEFGYGKVKIMDQSLAHSANQLVDDIKTYLLDSSDGIFAVETQMFSVHVLNIVWNLVGSYKFDPSDKLLKRNMKCVDKSMEIYGHENLYTVFPFLRTWFPNQVRYPEHLKIHEEIHGFSKFLIDDAREKRNQRLDVEPVSFIEVFLDKIEECEGSADTIFTNEQLEIILEDLFLASVETTGTILNWSILFMVLNRNVQAKVRNEICGKLADNTDFLSAMELKNLPYLKATILEILRVGNVVPSSSPRCPTKDVEIRNYIIPKGTILFYNLYAIYNDKNYWQDPQTFRPERFLNENGEIDALRSEKILNTVFGTGTRACFGENIGLDSLFTFFAALIINFKFDSVPGQEPSAENPNSGFTIYPRPYSVKITALT